jgi:hypothetical protein
MGNVLPISAQEIADGDLELPIRQAEPHCGLYTFQYEQASRQLQNANSQLANTYQTLAILTSFLPNFDSPAEPYLPMCRSAAGRSAVPDDLTDEDLTVLPLLLERLTEPALKARILDVLWIRQKAYQAALQAVDAYVLAAEKLFSSETWIYGVECLRRGFQLAAALAGGGRDARQKTQLLLEKTVQKPLETIHLNFANHLLRLAAEFRLSEPGQFAAIALRYADISAGEGEFDFARQYHKLAAGLFDRAGDRESTRNQMLRVADLFEEEADSVLTTDTPRALAAVTFLKEALEINRQFKVQAEKIESIRQKLRQAQTRSLDHFQELRVETNIADLQQLAATYVSGTDLEKAILRLAFIVDLTDLKAAVEEQLKQAKQSPFFHLITTELLDEQGKTSEKIQGIDGTVTEEELEKRAFQWAASFKWPFRVQAAIEPARSTIASEYAPRSLELEFLVRSNPLVASDHALIFLRGLHAGLMGDMMVAIHLLVPQLENALRYLLNQHGIDTANIDSEGLEQNKALGKLLEFPELHRLLGDDLIFEFRAVFCEKSGFNLRNRLAHGQLSRGDCLSFAAVSGWWLILRACCAMLILGRTGFQTQGTKSS